MSVAIKYSVIEATLISSRVDGNDIEVDLTSNIIEVTTFEHISKPYIDCELVFVDDFGLKDTLSVSGTEKFRITFGQPDSPQEDVYTKFFFVKSINDTVRINESGEMLSVQLVEDLLFIDSVKQLSRSYNGKIEDIIQTICQVELGRNVVRSKFEGSAQGIRKILVPYLSPLETINWIKDRATTRTGGPIYLFSTMYSNDLIMSDFDSLMQETPFNALFPLRFNSAVASIEDDDDELRPYFEVVTFRENSADDLMRQIEDGNVGSYYANLDIGTGRTSGAHISIRDIVDEFYVNNLLDPETAQTMFDPSLLIDGKLSDEYNSNNIFQITSSNTFNQFKSYHDESVLINQKNELIESKLKIKNKIIRAILKKNLIDIGIDGRMIFDAAATVGDRIRVLFLSTKDLPDSKTDIYDRLDKRKSGDFLIMAINHRFSDDSHTAVLRLAKLGEIPRNLPL